MRQPEQIIKRPLLTEKSARLLETGGNQPAPARARDAQPGRLRGRSATRTRSRSSDAVETLFKVKVTDVNTLDHARQGEAHRARFVGKTPNWKKAIVTLKDGDNIEFFEGVVGVRHGYSSTTSRPRRLAATTSVPDFDEITQGQAAREVAHSSTSRARAAATTTAASRRASAAAATSSATASSTSRATRSACPPRSRRSSTIRTARRASRSCTTSTARSATSSRPTA